MDDCTKKTSRSIINSYSLFFRILFIIFVAEFLVMIALWFINMPAGVLEFILDSVLLSVLSAPFLYFGVVRVIARKLRDEALHTQVAREKELKAKAHAENLAVKAYADNIVKSVNSGLVVVDSDLNVFRVNSAFCRMFSMKAEDVEGRGIDDILPVAELEEALNDALKNGNESEDNVFESSLGDTRCFRISGSIIKPSESEALDNQLLFAS